MANNKKALPLYNLLVRDEGLMLLRGTTLIYDLVIHSWDTESLRSLYPLHITVDTVCSYSYSFQADAQRRVLQIPSTASHQPAALCASVFGYYSSSLLYLVEVLLH